MKPTCTLTAGQRLELVHLRDHSPKAYLRERAAAILQLGEGRPGAVVARSGLLRPRAADTIYAWRNRYRRFGLAGLRMTPGRGRKPALSPPAAAPTSGDRAR